MAERKLWLPQEDEVIKKLVKENEKRSEGHKWKWSQIAKKLSKKLPTSKRTGKQCRERWHNQLDPSISVEEWSQQEISQLFTLQNEHGNKWAHIAKQLPGRTDNNIKNFFYSSLRRAIRKVNQYVGEYKKKSNIKPFQPALLTKILSISDENHRLRLDIKNQKAISIAQNIKNMLALLSQQDDTDELTLEDKKFMEKLVQQIQEFNRNCKKKKGKRNQPQENVIQEQLEQESIEEEPKPTKNKKSNETKPSLKNKQSTKNEKQPKPQIVQKPLFQRKQSRIQEKPVLERKSSRISRKDSNLSNRLLHNSLFEDLGAMDFNIQFPQMTTRKSSKESRLFELNPLTKKQSFKLCEDINPYQSFNLLQSRDYLAFNQMKPLDSSLNESRLFRRDSRYSKKSSF